MCLTKEVKGSGIEFNGVWYCSQVHKDIAVKPTSVPVANMPVSAAQQQPVVQTGPGAQAAPGVKKIPVEY